MTRLLALPTPPLGRNVDFNLRVLTGSEACSRWLGHSPPPRRKGSEEYGQVRAVEGTRGEELVEPLEDVGRSVYHQDFGQCVERC
jgi:hypothetical protein